MTANPAIRRTIVTIGVAAALMTAGLTVRAASLWAAGAAPLGDAPVSATSLEQTLAQERARSAALQDDLDGLRSLSAQLSGALQAAQDRLTADQSTANDLRASLAAAQAKLASLQASLKASAGQTTSAGGGGGRGGGEVEGGEGHDD
jgi:Tfp pilus assembly protein FimV